MNLLQCQCFCAAAEAMNFTQAAQKLFISQPAIGRLVISLEKDDFVTMSRLSSLPGHDFILRIAEGAGFIPNVAAYASYLPELVTMVTSGERYEQQLKTNPRTG